MLARTIVLFVLVRTIVLTQPRRSHVSVPTIGHVALTVRDLGVSVPWYNDLFEVEPVLDEDTGPFRHVVWAVGAACSVCTSSRTPTRRSRSASGASAWIMCRSGSRTGPSSSCARSVWTSSASHTARSRTPVTVPACPSAPRTGSPWSSSRRLPDRPCAGLGRPAHAVGLHHPPEPPECIEPLHLGGSEGT